MAVSAMNIRPIEKFPRQQLVLSPWKMMEENFPVCIKGIEESYTHYIYTRADTYTALTPNSPMWSVDCEMCITTMRSELTRISITDENHGMVYETLVQPYNSIIDYVTQFSGITPSMLRNVNTRLEDVQAEIQATGPPDLILVGHGLNNYLHAMKISVGANQLLSGPRSTEESRISRIILESREAAGMAHISVAKCRKFMWPQLIHRYISKQPTNDIEKADKMMATLMMYSLRIGVMLPHLARATIPTIPRFY